MKSVIRQIVELMGDQHEALSHRLLSELEIANELEIGVEEVRIATAMMQSRGMLQTQVEGGESGLALSEKGLQEYRAYRSEGSD